MKIVSLGYVTHSSTSTQKTLASVLAAQATPLDPEYRCAEIYFTPAIGNTAASYIGLIDTATVTMNKTTGVNVIEELATPAATYRERAEICGDGGNSLRVADYAFMVDNTGNKILITLKVQ